MQCENFLSVRSGIVAIPAQDEEQRIESCLAALACQRTHTGAPLDASAFQVLVLANNCRDDTAKIARRFGRRMPFHLMVTEEVLPISQQSAGGARKRVMDLAATRLGALTPSKSVILTTDADSCVAPTWVDATIREFDAGADCVAGYIDAHPLEITALSQAFRDRGRLEDLYLAALAEISARCDPRLHNPWPNHRVSSGASLAITLAAYLAIGGLPLQAVGEDHALTSTLDKAGFKVRHSLDVVVSTSCRFDGRARGGAADTMRSRHDNPNAFCDDDVEPAFEFARRMISRGYLRRNWTSDPLDRIALFHKLGARNSPAAIELASFSDGWDFLCSDSIALARRIRIQPGELPAQINRARIILAGLGRAKTDNVQADTPHHAAATGSLCE